MVLPYHVTSALFVRRTPYLHIGCVLCLCFSLAGRLFLFASRGFSFFRGSEGFALVWVVHQFDDRQFGVITHPLTKFHNARIAAGPIFVTLSQLIKQALQCRHARGSRRPQLSALAS